MNLSYLFESTRASLIIRTNLMYREDLRIQINLH